MSQNYPDPSAPPSQSSSGQLPQKGLSWGAPNTSSRPITLHHRAPSASALTIQTHFARQSILQAQQGLHEHYTNKRFSHLLNTALGSPFLTTADTAQMPSYFSLDGNEVEERDPQLPRPPSPSPTADYSIIDVEEADGDDNSPIFRIPGSYPYGHRQGMSSPFAGLGFRASPRSTGQKGSVYCPSAGLGGTFTSFNHTTESASVPNITPHPPNPLRTLLPRLWDALSSPSRAVLSGNNNLTASPTTPSPTSTNSPSASSPGTFSHSISLPTGLFGSQSQSDRQSPSLWGGLSKPNNKGKGKAQHFHYSPSTPEPAEDLGLSEFSPLDGEEGELVDEACFVDVRAITGVDILALLPPELALHILHLVCPPPCRDIPYTARLDPLSNEVEEESAVALRAILACLAVSHTWWRLASDNSVWRALFLGRWDIDLRRADLSHIRKPRSLVRYVGSPPRFRRERHRWNFKNKAQTLKFGVSLRAITNPPGMSSSPSVVSGDGERSVSGPNANFPLQFDWKKMYMERLELERRWRGTAYTRSPMLYSDKALSSPRNAGRCTPRSRSLSPARLLGPTSSPEALTASVSGSTMDRLAAFLSSRGTEVSAAPTADLDLGSMSISRTEPVGMGTALYREEKWEPDVIELRGHTDSVYCVEFDSKRIITGSRDRNIMVWSLKTGKLLGSFAGHRRSVLCLKFEKDWDFAPSCPLVGYEGRVRDELLSTGLDRDIVSDTGLDTQDTVDEDGFKLRGKGSRTGFMVSGSSDCTICVWSLETGDVLAESDGGNAAGRFEDGDKEVRAEPIAVLEGHTGGVLDLRIDQKWIVSCSKDTVIRVWNRKTLELHRMLRGHEGPVNAVGLQEGRVVSASGDGKMILWDLESGERLRTFEGHDRGLACIDFKNNLIASGSNDCKIRVWNAYTGECLKTFAGHGALVRALAFDAKTGRLVSASYDKVVKVWDVRSGKLIREFKHTHTSHIFDVKFDARRIVSTSHDQKICVLDFTAGLDASVFI